MNRNSNSLMLGVSRCPVCGNSDSKRYCYAHNYEDGTDPVMITVGMGMDCRFFRPRKKTGED